MSECQPIREVYILHQPYVPSTESQFPPLHCHCDKKSFKLSSAVSMAIQCPRSFRKAMDLGSIVPMVSIATGVKLWLARRPRYFSAFLSFAFSATFPASWWRNSYMRWQKCQDMLHPGQPSDQPAKVPVSLHPVSSHLNLKDLLAPAWWREHKLLSGLASPCQKASPNFTCSWVHGILAMVWSTNRCSKSKLIHNVDRVIIHSCLHYRPFAFK